MKRIIGFAAAVSIATVPLAAQEIPASLAAQQVDLSSSTESAVGPSLVVGEPASAEELEQARGGNAVAIVIAGIVVGVRSCSTNAICRTVATAIIKALGKKAGDIIIEKSTPALHRKLCSKGFRRYC